jgi:cytochrome c oxidase subunit II
VIRGFGCVRAFALALVILPALFISTHARAAAEPAIQEAHKPPVEVTVVAKKYSFDPARIEVDQDDIVKVTLKTEDIPHSFTIDDPYRIAKRAAPAQPVTFEFRADRAGTFTYYCSITTDGRCKDMHGQLVVNAKR